MTVTLKVNYGLTEAEIKEKGYTFSKNGYLLTKKGHRVVPNVCAWCGEFVEPEDRYRTNKKVYHKQCFEKLLH